MSSSLFFPTLLVALAVFGWNVSSRRIEEEVAEWGMTPQEGRRHVFLYRGWSVALAVIGVVLAILTFAAN